MDGRAGILDNKLMKFNFRPHFKFRAKQRGIDASLAKKIFKKPSKRYWDTLREHNIVPGSIRIKDRRRNLIVAYDKIGDRIEFITIHFIRGKEITNKINSGRWKNEQN
ncbi:MAG: hypothetical protein AAB512_04640 [Patescibacteria group bacterium]